MGIAWVLMTASLQLAPVGTADIPACGVELQVRAKASVMAVEHQQFDSWTAFEVELVNSSDRTVTLVMPGDGSDVAWRTPVVQWSVSSDTGYRVRESTPCRANGNEVKITVVPTQR
jgi:hypothetical protein